MRAPARRRRTLFAVVTGWPLWLLAVGANATDAAGEAATTPAAAAAATPGTVPSPAPTPQQFLAILRPVERLKVKSAWTKADEEAVGRHFRRLQEAAAAGTVLFAGRTQEPLDATLGLVVFEAVDAAAAKAWAEADPAVVAGVMTVDVRPYQVAVQRR
jgi:uncharacterized protein YciI